jgi:aconitate hydratase
LSSPNGFGARSTLDMGGESFEIFRLDALQEKYDVARLPYALKVLLENLIRNGEDEGAEAVARWSATDEPSQEIAYRPARVLMQDFTGVPAIVDLAAMRDAMEELGGDATKGTSADFWSAAVPIGQPGMSESRPARRLWRHLDCCESHPAGSTIR